MDILNHYAISDGLDISYFLLKDSYIMLLDTLYSKYGPAVYCGYIKDEYSKLFKNSIWLAVINLQTFKGRMTLQRHRQRLFSLY